MNNKKSFLEQVKHTFNPKVALKDLLSLHKMTYIMLFIMLITQVITFIVSGKYSFEDISGLVVACIVILNLILVDEGKISNYLFGTFSCTFWLLIAIQNKLYGDVASQSFYVIMQFVGIYMWNKHLVDEDTVQSRKIGIKKGIFMTLLAIILYMIILYVSHVLNGNQILLDSALLPLGIIGQMLMSVGYASQWIVWIAIDIINVIIWGQQLIHGGVAATSMFVLQITMLINAIYGAYCWYKNSK